PRAALQFCVLEPQDGLDALLDYIYRCIFSLMTLASRSFDIWAHYVRIPATERGNSHQAW
ncbi:MAG: hypothetical protein ACLPKW_11535, partial [Acetobacteraceae bacterium]